MKTWNTPEIEELNIADTANGYFDTWFESWVIHNDSDKKSEEKPVTPTPDPVVPIDPVDQNS